MACTLNLFSLAVVGDACCAEHADAQTLRMSSRCRCALCSKVDHDGSDCIDFEEFTVMMSAVKNGRASLGWGRINRWELPISLPKSPHARRSTITDLCISSTTRSGCPESLLCCCSDPFGESVSRYPDLDDSGGRERGFFETTRISYTLLVMTRGFWTLSSTSPPSFASGTCKATTTGISTFSRAR